MCREVIVARSTLRFAAGAGVIVASFLLAGPNPAQAWADKHGSDSHNKTDNRKSGSNVSGRTTGSDSEVGIGAPQTRVALRSAAVADTGDNVSTAAPSVGSAYSGQPTSPFTPPRVVFGNGRIPGTHTPGLDSTAEGVLRYDGADAPAVAPVLPDAVQIDGPPLPPPPFDQIHPSEFVVAEFGYGTADTVTDPLAGVAGLILIPAVGAVLGYRQARSAQSLRDSVPS